MTEFHELVKEAPNFNTMERDELVTYAYAMFAAGTKADSENAKLRELVRHLYEYRQTYFKTGIYPTDHGVTEHRIRELGVEVES